MHPSVQEFVQAVLGSDEVKGARVLEVGSYDVNGSVRPYLESLHPAEYVGVDASPGPSVDRVVDCEQLCAAMGFSAWDVVVSAEMLEHVRNWGSCIDQLVMSVKQDGLLLITTRSPGFPYHPFPEDHWRFTQYDMQTIADHCGLEVLTLQDDPQCEGVFLLARRSGVWSSDELFLPVERVTM
jgi:hypothetical protein